MSCGIFKADPDVEHFLGLRANYTIEILSAYATPLKTLACVSESSLESNRDTTTRADVQCSSSEWCSMWCQVQSPNNKA